jgi:hypothetical protein
MSLCVGERLTLFRLIIDSAFLDFSATRFFPHRAAVTSPEIMASLIRLPRCSGFTETLLLLVVMQVRC